MNSRERPTELTDTQQCLRDDFDLATKITAVICVASVIANLIYCTILYIHLEKDNPVNWEAVVKYFRSFCPCFLAMSFLYTPVYVAIFQSDSVEQSILVKQQAVFRSGNNEVALLDELISSNSDSSQSRL